MKQIDKIEISKLKNVLEQVKNEIERNEKLYSQILRQTEDEEVTYYLTRTYENKIKNLERALSVPYFARVDFKANDEDETKKIYIGKTNIFDDAYDLAVVDWRAPISSIYYDGKIGYVEYICPDGTISGNLSLKRQYSIEKGNLLDYKDIDITTNDELLQNCLNENSDIRLKNIVSTIQSEQNKIIRSNMFTPVIVQGVAGSGKTTVALHRIAYLVYTYEKSFKPEDFLIIAPNKFFLDYISNVLPDLGVDYVRQQTFEEFALDIIDRKLNIKNPYEQLSEIVEKDKKETNLLQEAAKFKSSMEFKCFIDKCIEDYKNNILPKEDFKILNYRVMKHEELQEIIEQNFKQNSLVESVELLNNILQKKVSNIANELVDKITKDRSNKINKIDKMLDENKQQEIRRKIFKESEYEIAELLKGGKKLVKDYIKKIKITKIEQLYKEMVTNKESLINYISDELSIYIINTLNTDLKNKKMEYEDLTALLYLKYKIYGLNESFVLKHIVIDEAQDYSEFQFYTLYEILQRNKSMTILGDIAQGIFSYRGTNNWKRINKLIFNNQAAIEKLDKSYRTTAEIMNEANKILCRIKEEEDIDLAIPISRHGDRVNYIKGLNFDEKVKLIEKRIVELKNKGYKNIAIITKNSNDANELYKKIDKKNYEINLIAEKLDKFIGGSTIVPSYLSKGLEFDSVIIFDFDKYDDSNIDIKLLYVAMTRAMHTLDIFI